MKNIFLLLLLIIGCGGSGVTAPNINDLVGNWTLISESTIEAGPDGNTFENISVVNENNYKVYNFLDNDTWSLAIYEDGDIEASFSGTYSLSDNILSMTVDYGSGNITTALITISISDNQLTYTYTRIIGDGPGSITVKSIWQKSIYDNLVDNQINSDIVGIWDATYHDMNMTFDVNIKNLIYYTLSYSECLELNGTYNNGCTLTTSAFEMVAQMACDNFSGTLNGDICSNCTMNENIITETETQTYTIDDVGNVSILTVDEEGSNIITGNLLIDGANISISLQTHPTLTGTFSLSNNTMIWNLSAGSEAIDYLLASLEAPPSGIDPNNYIENFSYSATIHLVKQ